MGYISEVNLNGQTHKVGSSLYGTCGTTANVAEKTVTLADYSTLTVGTTIHVKFSYSNSVANPTLNVNSLGAIPIYKYGTTAPGASAELSWNAGAVLSFTYDGTAWMMNDWINMSPEMEGATAQDAGAPGLVPAPSAGDNVKYLRGDKTFAVPGVMTIDGRTPDPVTGNIVLDDIRVSIANVADGLAILATGNTHAYIASGQFVYVRNHGTADGFSGTAVLADGLYVAQANISANGSLTTSNLAADGSGGLNALKSKIGNVGNTDLQTQVTSLSSKISNLIETEIINMPATSWEAGAVGTWIETLSKNVTKTGYELIGAFLRSQNSAVYLAFVSFSSSVVSVNLFRTTNTAENINEGNCKVQLIWQKS